MSTFHGSVNIHINFYKILVVLGTHELFVLHINTIHNITINVFNVKVLFVCQVFIVFVDMI